MTLPKHYQFSLSKLTRADFYVIFHISMSKQLVLGAEHLWAEMTPTRRFLHPLFCINIGHYFHCSHTKTKPKTNKTFRNLCLQTSNFRIGQQWLSSCPATRELQLLIVSFPFTCGYFWFHTTIHTDNGDQ